MRRSIFLEATMVATVAVCAAPAWADDTPECNTGDGASSLECGSGTFAMAPGSTVVGNDSVVTTVAENGTAIGNTSRVGAAWGTAIGTTSFVNPGDTGTISTLPVPEVIGGTAVGGASRVSGGDGVAVGAFAVVGVRNSFSAVNRGTAIGAGSLVSADGGTALGSRAQVLAQNAVAIGSGSVADQADTVSFGSVGAERRLVNIAAGVDSTDAVNMSQLTAESSARSAADVQLGNALLNESNARAAADTQLVNALTSETNARLAADSALSSRMDVMAGRLDHIDSRLDRMEDHVASGTAVAVAMSGNTFLPNTTFNLTANVGTYDGAHAGSLQIGAMVGPNVAVNAGVATGFNKRGKTAARAGLTIGW